MTHGSLFSGIGGFDLGLERAGIKTVWQVEIDEYCRRVLERHWPGVARFADIRDCGVLPRVDVITGGFPCQDVSECGQRVGIDGKQSGLWAEMFRLVSDLRPRFVVVENVPGLLNRGIGRVLGNLASIGYDSEWQSISAASFGFPHIRERIWIIAYPAGQRMEKGRTTGSGSKARFAVPQGDVRIADWRETAALFRGVDDGIPRKVERGQALGNALIPDISEWLGRRILEADRREQSE